MTDTKAEQDAVNLRLIYRRLDATLEAIASAIRMTVDQGPSAGMESLANYMNEIDAVLDDDNIPDDWIARWQVTRR